LQSHRNTIQTVKICLARPLALLYNQLFSDSTVPPTWKQAIITSVFKKGAAGAVCNYRPISLTRVASKIMERIIAKQIYVHLLESNLLSSAQHGFVKGRSTCSNFFDAVNDWTSTVQNKKAVTIAYIDFSRAFGTVSHNKVLLRLYSYGIRGLVFQFFRDRTRQTIVGECLSPRTELLSGVVQSNGIGPVLFLIYIDDLAKTARMKWIYSEIIRG